MTEAFGLSDIGCVRTNNEDYFRLVPERGLYLLADGMGGAKAGERASEMAVQSVVDAFEKNGARDSAALLTAVETANARVREAAKNDPGLEGMGTTLVAVLDMGESLLVASVGDSRGYLLEGESLQAITQDQSWVNEVGRPLGIDEASLRTHPLRNVLTMAIGASANLVVNRYTAPWRPHSLALLSSDGLHGVVSPEQLEEILRSGGGLESMGRRFIEAAREAGAPDNVTVVLLRRVD